MKSFEQKFTIHPVGHGLFYSGIMKFQNDNRIENTFRFVFDCGSLQMSKKQLYEEIEVFHNNFKENETLDLLVISHFHSDHINGIKELLAGRKVKRVIAPFIDFKERLFLFLLYISSTEFKANDPDSLFILQFILDPINTIQDYLTDGGEIVFIKSGVIEPFEQMEENPNENVYPAQENVNNSLFEIDFSDKLQDLSPNELAEFPYFGNIEVKILKDTSRISCSLAAIPFMEFLFYHKYVDQITQAFQKVIEAGFVKEFPELMNIKDLTSRITTLLEEQGISQRISKILRDSLNQFPQIKTTITEFSKPNTTSLSLLHCNTNKMYHFLDNLDLKYFPKHAQVIYKLDGTNKTRCEFPITSIDNWKLPFINNRQRGRSQIYNVFPNTLLTSDGVLLSDADIDPFYQKYQYYWLNFWLFQIPHHGSKYNIDRNLLSRIAPFIFQFINHSIKKSSKHPSPEVISEVTLTGHSCKLLSVNECMGLKFGLSYVNFGNRRQIGQVRSTSAF
jgi:hypothetical protein